MIPFTVRFAVFFVVAITGCAACLVASAQSNAAQPNVLLILTDDQGWGDLGSNGNEIIETPTLDRLAKQSARLDRFYVSPVCAPTRAASLTGRYPERTGVAGVTSRREVMRSNETTIAELFQESGYATGCFGKWHNGAQMPLHPNGQGFEEFFGFCGGHFNLYDDPLLERNGVPVQTKGYITDVITDAAIEFINQDRKDPFFCYVPYNAPHGPFQVRQDLFDKYNTGHIDEKTAAVYAMVENIDTNVNRLLETLNDRGNANDTIVLFFTDNGPNGKRFNGGMKGTKGSVHEGGCRVPCFIRWPGKIQPRAIQQIAGHIDLLPTLCDWCDVDYPDELQLDGRSLAELIREGVDSDLTDRVLLTYRPNQAALGKFGKGAARTNQYRMTIERGRAQLFEMHEDPGQRVDVAAEQLEITQQLRQQLESYVDEITPSITTKRFVPVSKSRPVYVPSVDATLAGNPNFADGISWAHSWVDHWQSAEDSIAWPMHFKDAGRYQITLHYVCNANDVVVEATIGEQRTSAKLTRADVKSVVRPDLDSKSTPRRMLEFRTQSLGALEVDAGHSDLQLARLTNGPMIELGGVTITSADIPAKESFHLFLLAGQSNMAGRGKVTPRDHIPDARILMLDREGVWVPATDPLHFDKSIAGVGLGRGFARAYARQNPSVTIGLVPCAVGGSPISSWLPGGEHRSTRTHPYDDAVRRMELAAKQGEFKGILWHQGESDSHPDRSPTYKKNLLDLFGRFRSQLRNDIPIVIGQLAVTNQEKWSPARKQVDHAHQEIAEELPNCQFVSSKGLSLKSDNVHFDRSSLLEFGKRYADALNQGR